MRSRNVLTPAGPHRDPEGRSDYIMSFRSFLPFRARLLRVVPHGAPKRSWLDHFRVADHSDRTTVMAGYSSASPGAREEFGEVCCAIDSHVDRTFLIEVFLLSAAQKFLRAGIMNKFRRNSARILASRKECYDQKNRSAQ